MSMRSMVTGTAAVGRSPRGGSDRHGRRRRTSARSPSCAIPPVLTEQAPATFKANFDTSKGAFVIQVHRDWAPLGADRFYNLVKNGFYDDVRFFRVIPSFMAQFGIHGNPAVAKAWRGAQIKDDPVKQSNKRGYVTFATGGPNTRTTQVFINFGDNAVPRQAGLFGVWRGRHGYGRG